MDMSVGMGQGPMNSWPFGKKCKKAKAQWVWNFFKNGSLQPGSDQLKHRALLTSSAQIHDDSLWNEMLSVVT